MDRVDWFDVTLRWYLVTTLVTLALAPAALLLFRRVTDRGASATRPVAALLLIWPVWFLAGIGPGLVPFSAVALWVVLVLLGVALWAVGWRAGIVTPITLRHLAIAEAGHLVAFAGFFWFRGFGPQANWQEKPSDLMMFASTMRAEQMPPADAWLAGETINYYYLGYAVWAAIAKMIDTTPAIAFNLALVSTFAMAFVVAAGLVANALARWYGERAARVGGLLAALFILFLGNPDAAFTALGDWTRQWEGTFGSGIAFFDGIGWTASRVIIDDVTTSANPISEFPAFSFVLGDPHPHLLALPFAIASLSFAWMLLTLGRLREGEALLRRDGVRIAAAGWFIGALYAMNSWDLPTCLLIALLALTLGTVGVALRVRLLALGLLVGAAVVPWLPFYVHFEAPARPVGSGFAEAVRGIPLLGGVLGSIGSYQGERTSPQEYFAIFGFMYPVAILLIVLETWRRRDGVMIERARTRGTTWRPDPLMQRFAVVTAILCLLGSLVVPAPLLVICGLPVIMVWLLIDRDFRVTGANVALVLYAIAMIMTLVPEFFYLSDIYGSRMNTVFKVYYQVWLLMAVATAIAVMVLWRAARPYLAARVAVPAAVAGVVVLGLVYPVVAGKQWLDWRAPEREWQGVDGLAYLRTEQGGLYAGEYAAIRWLWENATADDVILAAGGGEWHNAIGRVSSGSGVPTLIGWAGHEDQWHLGEEGFREEVVIPRVDAIRRLYEGPPEQELLDRYGVTLIYIGPTERQGIGEEPTATLAPGPFPGANDPAYPGAGWTEVFNEGGSRIYRRDGT